MKKLKNKKGFSLGEVLVAVLIMGMVTGVVAAGMPAAINAYKKIVEISNAQLLATTTTNTLRNQLYMARDVHVSASEGTGVTIDFKAPDGSTTRIVSAPGELITVQEYYGYEITLSDGSKSHTEPRPLVNPGASSQSSAISGSSKNVENMYVEIGGAEISDGYLTLKNITVSKKETTTSLADADAEPVITDTELISLGDFIIKTE